MVELIITETGFPKSRPALKEFQDSFLIPINEILRTLPGNRILSGFESSGGGSSTTISAGILLYKGRLWTSEAYTGGISISTQISFFEEVETLKFNVGTQAAPVYEYRPGKIRRTAKIGDHAGRAYIATYSDFIRGRKILEYLKAGSVFIGPVVVATSTTVYRVDFGENIGTYDYQVLANFRALDPALPFSRAFTWDINNRTQTGFDIMINDVSSNSIPLMFDYTVIPINRASLTATNP